MVTGLYIFLSLIILLQIFTIYLVRRQKEGAAAFQEAHPAAATAEAEEWRNEVIRTLEFQCLQIRNAVDRQTEKIHYTEMKLAPKHSLGADDRLLQALTEEQIALIKGFYQIYHNYLNNHWYTSKGSLKTVFSGAENDLSTDAGKLVQSSRELRGEMDAWFLRWREHI